jgi:hypothetical protein
MWMRTGGISAGAAVLLLTVACSRPQLYLEFRAYPDERILLRMPVGKGDHFSTLITHSVHLSPVYETYRIEGEDRIVLESTRLKDLGWGVPSTFEHAYALRNGFMIIGGYEKILPFLPFRVSAVNDAKLLLGDLPDDPAGFGGKTIRLDAYAPDGKRITIRIVRVNGIVDVFQRLLSQRREYAGSQRGNDTRS